MPRGGSPHARTSFWRHFSIFRLGNLSCLQRDSALSVCPWTCSYSNSHALGASFFIDFCVFNLGTSSAFSAIQRHRFVHGHVHIPIPMPWGHRFSLIPVMKMAVILRRIFAQFGGSWRPSWDHFALMLGHLGVLEALWEPCSCWKSFSPPKRRPFWRDLEAS